MKDYKRLTRRDGNVVTHMEPIKSSHLVNRMEEEIDKEFELIYRLAELEDKIESGELCDRKEIIMVKGKVIDEPNEWVCGQLLPNNRILQSNEHSECKNCGVGVFEVIPETITIVKGIELFGKTEQVEDEE